MNFEIIFGLIKTTEKTAIAAYKYFGKQNNNGADQEAVNIMRPSLNEIDIRGNVVIGEGERDNAPMLYIGEKIGKKDSKGKKMDIAVDPIDGTDLLSKGKDGAISVIAAAESGNFLKAPDIYMDKIATGFNFHEQILDLDISVKENLYNLAKAKKSNISDLTAIVLNRPRHEELIAKILELGAKVMLIDDGDIIGIISTTSSYADMYIGTGGAPEAVIAAAALQVLGGQICTRLNYKNQYEIDYAKKCGIQDINKKYYKNDLAAGNIIFAATGITDNKITNGIQINKNHITTDSLLLISEYEYKEIKKIQTKYPI
ncbi:class II fructose-bisphosphatase [Rickettsia endosymbiont of Cardiosporidium cionae]|uniref:class II fructose-bisphosphatase n=1 Tax=Rickettsia endosymbiont of Cardiosporidium cionae TaxID=2777155 RepID=UPI00189593DA|nr:class II fructose-bisphosphatase [Rickettsia endosymbiont of Cardiosporidium cionae]KAF8818303.1 Fructose-1,6-bisphosphatase class 2 [Rickettsia endosymbiont of Cardiosporidium cionae]